MPHPELRRAAPRGFALLPLLIASIAALFVLARSKDRDRAGDAVAAPGAAPPAAAQPPQPGPQMDLSGVMKRVHLRFRPDGDGWVGGVGSHSARVGADGTRFTPRVSAKDGHPVQTGAPIVLGAPAVARGAEGGAAKAAAIVDQQRGLAIDRGLATELYENTEQGLEQSFRFEARPAGGGDVTVRVPVSGERYNGATAKGLHFVDDATRMGVRYGAATWVDAAGARTQVATRYEDGAIVLTVPAALVDGSAYPAVLDPVIGPEIGTDTPIFTNSNGQQQLLAVSYGGGQHLVAWYDSPPQGGGYALWGARVSAAGAVLDTYGIFLSYEGGQSASIAFDGTNWLVVWEQATVGVTNVYGTLVSAAGVAANPGGVPIASTGANTVASVAVSYGGGSYLVAYSDTGYGIHGQMVATTGTPTGAPFTISTVFTSGGSPMVAAAFNGTNHLVAYAQSGAYTYAREVTVGGMTASGDILVAGNGWFTNYLSVASDGADWMIAFMYNAGVGNIKITRVTAAGGAPDEPTGGVYATQTAGFVQGVSIVWDGTDYDVFYDKTISGVDDIYATRVTPSATIGTTYGGLINEIGSHYTPAVSFDTVNGFFFVAFDDNRLSTTDNSQDVRFNRFNTSFAKQESPSVLVTKGANDQQRPDAAWNGTDWLVVWEDASGAVPQIWGTRLDVNGNVLDTNGIQIDAQAGAQAYARVTSDGTNWLVAWLDEANLGLYAARVAPSGTVLDTTPVLVGSVSLLQPFGVAEGSSTYAITYYASPNIVMQRLSTSAVVLGTATIGAGTLSAVAFNGTNFLVEYAESGTPVQAKRVTPAGTILDTTPLTVSFSTATSNLAVTALGGQWLAGWVETGHTHASRISGAGTVLDVGGFVVASAAGSQLLFDANNDGTNYWMVWLDSRTNGYSYDVWGGRISSAGTLLDGTGFPIVTAATTPGLQNPALSGGPSGNLLVTYAHEAASPSEDALRVYSRIINGGAGGGNGSACTMTSQCTSGFCVDGVCCNTACNGACQACTAALKGSGADGTCGNAAAGSNPGNACVMAAQSSCGETGVCNGAGACALYAAGTTCGAGTCVGDTATPMVCNGNGSCGSGTGTSCSPYACAAGACTNPCSSNAQCIAGDTCTAGVCSAPQADGGACTTASQCQSGFCVEGVCCNTACSGACQACTAALKGSGSNGTCGNAAAGTNPNSGCTTAAMSTCGETGLCNGAGACALYVAGTTCGATTCVGDSATPQICDGNGNCGNGTGTSCSPYACASGVCTNPCSSSAQCAPGFTCNGGVCGTGSGNGNACSLSSQCTSGFCVDGVCCNSACTGLCQACSAAAKGSGADGVCGSVAAGMMDAQCTMQAASTCGQTGTCNGAGACQLYPAGTMCGASLCLGTVLKMHTCDGLGTCGLQTGGTDCTPYACEGTACATSCAASSDCAAGYVCNMGACVPPLANGLACTSGAACTSGFCVDGVCCNTMCNGLCQACSVGKKGQGASGTCGPILAGTDPDNECPASAQSTCGQNGQCDGSGACQLWAQGTSCGASSCQGTVVVGHVCNGTGTCAVPPGGTDCTPYACESGACANPCATNADCVSGDFCNAGVCKPLGAAGSPCTTTSQCTSGFCVDGVCCDSACTGACQACSAMAKGQGQDGTCGPLVAGSSCGPASCSGATATAASTCNGAGTCAPGATTPCAKGYVCAGDACATSCTDDTACAPGYQCTLEMCEEADGGSGDAGTNDAGSDAGPSDAGSDAGTGGSGTGGATTSTTGSTSGTGGTSTTSGTSGTGAAQGTGGAGGGTGGSAPGSKSGCSCHTTGGDDAPDLGAAMVLAGIALTVARRRRAAPSAR